jgi:hypothetical protein
MPNGQGGFPGTGSDYVDELDRVDFWKMNLQPIANVEDQDRAQ